MKLNLLLFNTLYINGDSKKHQEIKGNFFILLLLRNFSKKQKSQNKLKNKEFKKQLITFQRKKGNRLFWSEATLHVEPIVKTQ